MINHTVYRLSNEAKPCRVCEKLTHHYHTVRTDETVELEDGAIQTQTVMWKCYICDACDEHLYGDD